MNKISSVIREPELYDIFNSQERDDIDMYLSIFPKKTKVLELGIGTGRISIPLAKNGSTVVGVDNSEEMLVYLKNKLNNLKKPISSKIMPIHQDFCKLNLSDTFDYAFYPFCTFNYLLTIKQRIEALLHLKKHLNKNSQVIFDLMTINTFPKMSYDMHYTHSDPISKEDVEINISVKSSFNQDTKLFSQVRNYEYYKQRKIVYKKHVVMKNKILAFEEILSLLEKCGYKIKEKYGKYDFSNFKSSSRYLIIIATLK
jgi:SAM-dependent methyltransferase